MMRVILSIAGVSVLAVVLSACRDAPEVDGKPVVVATTTQVADLARNVAGDRARVVGLLAPNTDPHDFEPRPSDAVAIAESDLIIRSGGSADAWVDDLISTSGSDAPVVDLIGLVPAIPAEDGDPDPHWWQDPRNGAIAAEEIGAELGRLDSGRAAAYADAAARESTRLERLGASIQLCVDEIPARQRRIVTSHDSLAYMTERFGIDVVGSALPAQTNEAQPSAHAISELVELIRHEDVSAVFPESGSSSELAEAIADESGADVGEVLWGDSLGPAGSSGATYEQALSANASALVRGMSGGSATCLLDIGGSPG